MSPTRDLVAALECADEERARAALAALGATDPAAAADALLALARDHAPLAAEVARHWSTPADPLLALRGLERIAATEAAATLEALGREPGFDALLALVGGSEFLTSLLVRHPAWLAELAGEFGRVGPLPRAHFEALVRDELERADGDLEPALRRAKGRAMLRAGARDLAGLAPVEEVMAELSRLAEAVTTIAVERIEADLEREHGAACSPAARDDPEEPGGFVVLGMGKLGGEELNFSSDVDLIYLFHSDREETEGPSPVPVREHYTRLAERVTRALSRTTEDGFAFRVDLRLRPNGTSGAVVHSLEAATLYYESFGRTWERAALLKARPIAGNLELGRRFLERIEPFVFRRHLDYGTIEDMKEMKRRIDADLGAGAERERDVKLGAGGIREIEFIAQTLILVNGGREPRVRSRSTVDGLERLAAREVLERREVDPLVAAYRYLRVLEHRIQIHSERQSHRLPPPGEGLGALARRMGHRHADARRAAEALEAELERHRAPVRTAFRALFVEPQGERDRRVPAQVQELFGPEEPTPTRLVELGFRDGPAAARTLRELREGPPRTGLTATTRAHLDRVAPLLVAEVLASPDPDRGLAGLARFLERCGARGPYLALLAERPAVTRSLVRLFSSSAFLSEILLGSPELIDGLLRVDAVGAHREEDEMRAELRARLAPVVDDREAFMDELRRFRAHETLRIGFHDLLGELDLDAVTRQLSALAEACLEEALGEAQRHLRRRHGRPVGDDGREARMVVLGMGKLGGREIQYASDLDLIFLYDRHGETRDTARPIDNGELFARMVQRLISTLGARTSAGIVYAIDPRLRPSGNAGPLVTHVDAFRRYHRDRAGTWERQALVKARPVAGDAELGRRVLALRDEAVYGRGLDDAETARIAELRARMERELGAARNGARDLKFGAGGIVDVEFAVQVLQLRHGSAHPDLRRPDTLGALAAIERAGLLAAGRARVLADGYRFLREIERTLRVVDNRAVTRFPLSGEELAVLAQRLGDRGRAEAAGPAELRAAFERTTAAIRATYLEVLGTA